MALALLSFVVAVNGVCHSTGRNEIPTVEYCDLVRNPSRYDGKEIRLRGVYSISGKYDSHFFNSACGGGNTLWVDFSPDYSSCTAPALVKRLADMSRKSGPRWGRPHVTVMVIEYRNAAVEFVGTFRATNPYKRPKLQGEKSSAPANLLEPTEPKENYDYVFSVSCAERVKPLPKGAKL